MKRLFLAVSASFFALSAIAQSSGPPVPTTCDSTKIVSVSNAASGEKAFSPGSIAKIVWCDFELQTQVSPVASITMRGQPVFVSLAPGVDQNPASGLTSTILRGYSSYRPQEYVVQLPNVGSPLGGFLLGPAALEIRRGDTLLSSAQITLDEFAPGLFTMDRTPTGPVVATSGPTYVFPQIPARVGSLVTVYADGLGPTAPTFVPWGSIPNPDAIANTVTTPEVLVGGLQAIVLSSKLSSSPEFPSAAGVYEVAFIVPPVNAAKPTQQIFLRIGGKKSNVATLPVAP